MICEQCLAGVGQRCDERDKSIAQDRVEGEMQAVAHLEVMTVDKVCHNDTVKTGRDALKVDFISNRLG